MLRTSVSMLLLVAAGVAVNLAPPQGGVVVNLGIGVILSRQQQSKGGLPSIRDSLTQPVHVRAGDDALITCVVRDAGGAAVMWKREDRERHSRRVLTAGETRVTADPRFHVLHDAGGDVWVLVIKQSKPMDSGIYVCEVNSNPILRSFHKLSVLSREVLPPDNKSDPSEYEFHMSKEAFAKNHNYTDCCIEANVSTNCLGFCRIQSILEGNTGQDPEVCEPDFPAIVRCMADGRNHVPCCIQEGVPDICQDVCRGEYTVITDNIKTHFSCSAYTEQTLACIVEGVEILPSAPEKLRVVVLSDTSLQVSWAPPYENGDTVTEVVVNLTALRNFDDDGTDATFGNGTTAVTPVSLQFPLSNSTMTVKVPAKQNKTIVTGLQPFTMYEVTATAFNIHGSSLPSYAVRAVTYIPFITTPKPSKGQDAPKVKVPKLPDVRTCCKNKGITHPTCLDKMCEPSLSRIAQVTDLMICAPWVAESFSCLTNGQDHSPCCRARGLPALCQQLCTGNVTQIDFSYFKCVKHMTTFNSCLMQGYGVLPSEPVGLRVSNVHDEYAVVHWDTPKLNGDTVTSYILHYRILDNSDDDYQIIASIQGSPFLLQDLSQNSKYEVFLEAVNAHGVGEPSTRVVFHTPSTLVQDETDMEERWVDGPGSSYNMTACCVKVKLSEACLPICSYDANMSDIRRLVATCEPELAKLVRCASGGRNHQKCCQRRGAPSACLTLCAGVIVDRALSLASTCLPYAGNIVQCFAEGTGLLPGPVEELHVTEVTNSSVLLVWEPPQDGSNVTDYVIHYRKMDNTSMHEVVLKLDNQVVVTNTSANITSLDKGYVYDFFVVSRNDEGTSLPASSIMINVTETKLEGKGIAAVTSPPHSLSVASHSATYVVISWQPPEFSHPTEEISYRLYHKPASEEVFNVVETSLTTHMLENLMPNSQYIVYVVAKNKKGLSFPSETLIAWTDPAYPAFVEPPTVHPINLVIEGSSMTILCIAMGTPMPTISLYISGRLVRQETTRHMVTVVHNVTRDMNQISCYADNGYGTPMQASRRISISHVPHISGSGVTMAAKGDSVTLQCHVDSYPDPKMIFWRDLNGRVPVIHGGKYEINLQRNKDEESSYIMTLKIIGLVEEDEGDYFCHAENAFGSATQPVTVKIRAMESTMNVTQCCNEQNVSAGCMDACSFFLDIDAVIDKPDCINDFDKLMKCAADGSDHRSCCASWDVPKRCLDWCRGEPLLNNKFCVLSYTKQIVSCFHEGRDRLPGPPQNVKVDILSAHSALVSWDPPVKNPNTVEMYRVFWRPVGARVTQKNDTKDTKITVSSLKDGTWYEFVVKAGNHLGTSTLTEPVRFIVGDKYITSAANANQDSAHVGVIVGVVLALVIVAAIVVGVVWFLRSRRLLGAKSSGGVAFENPSYLREVNMDHIQIPSGGHLGEMSNGMVGANGSATTCIISGGSGQPVQAASPTQQGWKQEILHVPAQSTHSAASEVAPSLYEELKLGHDGAGFRRLKP
ncbi:Ig-like and fibronectin type-III domain-containing protein 1 isoform X1 [Ischnura elegans]|uniref:Ig-like and fibronectin type-III domain-containing protein 1 isoform X1 n=1 Tax=Ischnura elegans TaxID=197161 RepID=UPI001ED896EB|nr:Ig-like and fibronectin type-III domain-containing protein 1 isoform X1 [Ischnura elegans]XP_046405306.1 Ig-like and fibronectin type-III domain-containing protein 1 isoform X1 [Ischnura elegans]XP_046405307.1 Ig-like and fibronectin type-III domain-containing protein 1 isoform X1 [Ischnura elegans]